MKIFLTSILGLFLFCFSSNSFAITDSFTNPEDSYVRESSPDRNFGGGVFLYSDGVSQDPVNGIYGEAVALLKWDLAVIPVNSQVNAVSITLNLTNSSLGTYNLLEQLNSWDENTVNWGDLSTGATTLGTLSEDSPGNVTLNLNPEGIALVQGWVDGSIANNGIAIRTAGTNDGIIIYSKEVGESPPTLEVTYSEASPTLESLQAEINNLKALLAGVTRSETGIHFTGMNVHIENGLGATNGNPEFPYTIQPSNTVVNGLGNLIIGYNEKIDPYNDDGTPVSNKTGSHNIVVGKGHNYSSFGGIVVGLDNIISSSYSSITGGRGNTASSYFTTINGGGGNVASDFYSSINGGYKNEASGIYTNILGGSFNKAQGSYSSISGGTYNITEGIGSSVSGGNLNSTTGSLSSISGGQSNVADEWYSSVAGGTNNTSSGRFSHVSGGSNRTAAGEHDWVAGSLFEDD